ncbi:MAG: HD domain-containing phosphohydrolase [Clostridiaceae bacterium]
MSVKLKSLIIAIISIVFILVCISGAFSFIILRFNDDLETKNIKNDLKTVESLIDREENSLKRTAKDWSHWDETYNFMIDKNQEYVDENLQDNVLSQLNLNFMFYIDTNNNVVHAKTIDINDATKKALKDNLFGKEEHPNEITAFKNINEVHSGVIYIAGRLMILSSSTITTSDEKSESNGTLIMGRYVDENFRKYINETLKGEVSFRKVAISDNFNSEVYIKKENKNIFAESLIKDLKEESNIVVSIAKEREGYNLAIFNLQVFIVIIVVSMTIIVYIAIIFSKRYIFKPLDILNDFIKEVSKTKDTTARIEIAGDDEFSKIAQATNTMLSELNAAYNDINNMDKKYRIVMETTNDGILDLILSKRELYISPQWKEFVGYKGENGQELFADYTAKVHPDFKDNLIKQFHNAINGEKKYFEEEYKVIKKDGKELWILQRGTVVERNSEGKPERILSTLLDISNRKKYEEETLIMSYTDKLTGLRSRIYMENKFDQLDEDSKQKYYILMIDINGLKLFNDALGYKEGDKVLRTISDILREVCSKEDIISRWGGDEFIILINDNNEGYILQLISGIKEKCESISGFKYKISIALGYAKKDEEALDAQYIMSLAEKRMYRNKLMEDASVRSAAISSLLKTLDEKHSETEEHTMRIRNLSAKLGGKLGLSQAKLDELELLASLHDIGKIGIPEHILMKPSKLTEEEWVIMKTHTEIGYRIAKSTPELSHIANEILAHHEKYDGTGYPNGLKGDQIPLLARIINIVDSFDVMTNKRVYKSASSVEFAIEELIRCSGSQFDPLIVEEFIKLVNEQEEII